MADHEDEALSGDETERETVHRRNSETLLDEGTVIIENLRDKEKQGMKGFHTEPFMVGDHKWRLYYFPRGNPTNKNPQSFSVYIEALEESQDYRRDAFFRLTAKNHLGKDDRPHEAKHNFSPAAKDWGFSDFIRLEDLYDPHSGYLADGNFHILVETNVTRDFSIQREETGYIGILNQGATCYMNSLLQALFHLPYFRRVVYKMPHEDKGVTIPFALQAFFYRLQTSASPVSTKQLTKSFGWEDDDSFSQHDVTEFNRVLIDTLEMKMKGTAVEGTMEKLFRGQFVNYIQCVNVDYKSERPEFFYDLQMPIEGCKNIYESFRKYVLPEMLCGENKYHAEGHGLQDAKRGIRFKTLPDVLELNLNRFKQDFFMDRIQKINDRFEFYPIIDLSEFADPSDTQSTVYHLHGVLVHSGTMQGGHYNVFLRPTVGPEWYRFDDSSVRKSKERVAVDDNFGENDEFRMRNQALYRKFSSAYMLIYVRDSRVKEIFKPVEDGDIPPFMIECLEREQAELKRIEEEKEEAERCLDVGVITQEMLFHDKQEKFDMVAFAGVPKMKVRKEMTLRDFREKYAEENGIDNPEKIRFWDWISRKNRTERVDSPLTKLDVPFYELEVFKKLASPFVRLFAEVSEKQEVPFFRPFVSSHTVIIFFKYFDLENQQLRHVGHGLFDRSDKVTEFVPIARKLAGIPESENVRLYEEVKPLRIDALSMTTTLKGSELVTGDVIIVENDFPEEERSRFDNPHVDQFFKNILNRIVIQFHPMEKPDEEGFSLVLNNTMPYGEVAKRVGERVSWPQNKIRLFNCPTASGLSPIHSEASLRELVLHSSPAETLYFQKMDMTIEEFSLLRKLTVQFWQGARRYSNEDLLVKKDSTCADVVALLEKQVTLKGTKQIRLYVSREGFLEDIPPPECKVDRLPYDAALVAEEVSEEELNIPKGDELVKVMHYDTYHNRYREAYHGVPFFILIKKGDTYGDVKERIRKRLKVKKEEYSVWKFALIGEKSPSPISLSTPEDTPFAKLSSHGFFGIGLEHRRKVEKNYGWKEKGIAFKT